MTILDRYLLKRFVQVYLIAFISLYGLYVVVETFTNADDFLNGEGGPLVMLREIAVYFSYRISYMFDKIGGILTVMSAMVTLSLLLRHGELNPVLSAGVPTYRLIIPILWGALFVSVCMGANRELLIPRIAGQLQMSPGANKTTNDDLEPTLDVASLIHISGKRLNFANQSIELADFGLPPAKVTEERLITLHAKQALWKPNEYRRPGWLLKGVDTDFSRLNLTKFGRTVVYAGQSPQDVFIATDVGFDRLYNRDRNFELLSTFDLMRRMRSHSFTRVSIRKQSLHLHSRIIRPVLDLLMVVLGLPLIIRRGAAGLITNLAFCSLALGGVFAIDQGCAYLGAANMMAPDLAAWIPVIVAGTASAWVSGFIRT